MKQYRKKIAGMFPSPYLEHSSTLTNFITEQVSEIQKLRPSINGNVWLGDNPELTIDFDTVQNIDLPSKVQSPEQTTAELRELFQGYAALEHPLNANNLSPAPHLASIMAGIYSQIFPAQILEGAAAHNLHHAELEVSGMMANLLSWDPLQARSIFTYGGSGCWTYAVKYGLTRVLPESRKKGVRVDAKVICSTQSHFTKYNSTDWTGLGMDNIIQIPCRNDDNSMDMNELEKVLKALHESGTPVATLVCTAGTTDANAIDSVKLARELLDKYPNKAPYGKAILYVDAVAQWSWLPFKKYDFINNPLEFSQEALPLIQRNVAMISELEYADAVGVDFHKVGWAPLISSTFVYKNAHEFESMLSRAGSSYLQDRNSYNPRYYTLEVSRSQVGSLTAWASLKGLGYEGFQCIVGANLERQLQFRGLLKSHNRGVCVNPNNFGFDCMFRVYPDDISNPEEQYENELNNPEYRADLIKYNEFNEAIGDLLYKWWREGHHIDGIPTPRLSYSTGYRFAAYNPHGTDQQAKICALKVFPMNPNISEQDIDWMYSCVLAAREEILSSGKI